MVTVMIPARGGSKGIPRKNLAMLGDQSLLARAMDTATRARGVGCVAVSSNDGEILEAVQEFVSRSHIEVYASRRPEELSGDMVKTEGALDHTAGELGLKDDDVIITMQVTSPLTVSEDIEGVLETKTGYDSVFSGCRDHGGWLCGGFRWRYNPKTDVANPLDYELVERPMRQEVDTVTYIENGALWGCTVGGLRKHNARLYGRIGVYEMPCTRSFEIDVEEDLIEIRKYLWP